MIFILGIDPSPGAHLFPDPKFSEGLTYQISLYLFEILTSAF